VSLRARHTRDRIVGPPPYFPPIAEFTATTTLRETERLRITACFHCHSHAPHTHTTRVLQQIRCIYSFICTRPSRASSRPFRATCLCCSHAPHTHTLHAYSKSAAFVRDLPMTLPERVRALSERVPRARHISKRAKLSRGRARSLISESRH
jgi:hypothetical protein